MPTFREVFGRRRPNRPLPIRSNTSTRVVIPIVQIKGQLVKERHAGFAKFSQTILKQLRRKKFHSQQNRKGNQ